MLHIVEDQQGIGDHEIGIKEVEDRGNGDQEASQKIEPGHNSHSQRLLQKNLGRES